MNTGFVIALFGLAIIFYLLPVVIAAVRNCQHSGAIFMINLFLGWTVLGWLAALIWAIVEAPEVAEKPVSAEETFIEQARRDLPPAQTMAEAIAAKADRLAAK